MDNATGKTIDEWQLDEAKRLAESDYLTGLANRRGLHNYYEALHKDTVLHAMFIDIDNFKRVNDTYGHSVGDQLLVNISQLIQKYAHGFTSRIGGDEYVVLLDGRMSQEEVVRVAEDLLDNIHKIDFRKDILLTISLSIGIVMKQVASYPLDDILYKCDAAMYQAKYDGKNRYTVYKSYDKSIEINRNIEAEMEDALKNGEFHVYLQPKVNMVSSKLYGAEALSRWHHPVDGVRSPAVFISLFEKNGFISKLDMYVFEQICKFKAQWAKEEKIYAHIPISVNMSRLHLYNPDFPDMLLRITQEYGVDSSELEIEITESIFVKDSAVLIHMVDLLKERGFTVSIDDFGSGFSALNLLKDLPVDTIKIDKEFLQVSSDTSRGKKVIRNVIALCRDLKLDVVTEGIETKEQIEFITSCGCQIAQGFYYSKPVPKEEFEAFASEHLSHILQNYEFRFDGNLKSEDGSLEGTIVGEGLYYEQGIFENSKSLYFPGGAMETNMVELPPRAIVNDSFTVGMWIKPKELHLWVSALYIKFESGFASIIPSAWEGESDFRIRDSKEVNGWYDVHGCQLPENVWSHFTITYNAKTEKAIAFINGDVIGALDNVPTNRYVKRIAVGGDMFQQSFIGNICDIVIYNEAKDYDFVKNMYLDYKAREGFIGRKKNKN